MNVVRESNPARLTCWYSVLTTTPNNLPSNFIHQLGVFDMYMQETY